MSNSDIKERIRRLFQQNHELEKDIEMLEESIAGTMDRWNVNNGEIIRLQEELLERREYESIYQRPDVRV